MQQDGVLRRFIGESFDFQPETIPQFDKVHILQSYPCSVRYGQTLWTVRIFFYHSPEELARLLKAEVISLLRRLASSVHHAELMYSCIRPDICDIHCLP
jgi:hypothetical protein